MELINGLGGEAGFGENVLPSFLDGSSDAIDITGVFPNGLSFFGESYDQIFVNSNGNLTFDQDLFEFVPNDIRTLEIAGFFAFWTDIDVSLPPVEASPGGTSQGTNRVYYDLDEEAGTFTATWDDVRPYTEIVPGEVNAFQIRLIDISEEEGRDPGAFRAELRYETIDWTGGDSPFGDVTARIGFTVGDGASFVELGASGLKASLVLLEERDVLSFVFDDGTAMGGDPTLPIRGSDEDDLVIGTDGIDAIDPGAGVDVIRPGAGIDAIDMTEGAKTVRGTADELFGDRLIDAGWSDSLFFEGEFFDSTEVQGTLDGGALTFDLDGDGMFEGTIYLEITAPAVTARPLATETAEGTRISYIRDLPMPEAGVRFDGPGRYDIDPTIEAYLTGDPDVSFEITLASGTAEGTALGVYEIDADGALIDGRILAEDVTATEDTTFRLDDVEAGRELGFFLLTQADPTALGADGFTFVNQVGDAATLDDRNYVFAATENGILVGDLIHSTTSGLNQDLQKHAIFGGLAGSPGVTLAFENSLRFEEPRDGENNDFADVVLSIERVASDIL